MRWLLTRPDSLGDQLIGAGLVQALQGQQPGLQLVWHLRPEYEDLAALLPGANLWRPNRSAPPVAEAERLRTEAGPGLLLLPFALAPPGDGGHLACANARWWTTFLSAVGWDVAVAPLINRAWASDLTVAASRAPRRVGFTRNGGAQPLPSVWADLVPPGPSPFTEEVSAHLFESEWAAQARLLQTLVPGAILAPPRLDAPPDRPVAAGRRAAVAPGVGWHAERAWPAARWAEVAARWRRRGWTVDWIEGPSDAAAVAARPSDDPGAVRRFEPGALAALARYVAGLDLFFCHDTAYVHLAAALGTPTVAVFGAGQRDRFFPAYGRVKVVAGDPACRGCQWLCLFDHFKCVAGVPTEAADAAAQALIDGDRAVVRVPVPTGLGPPGAEESPHVLAAVQDRALAWRWSAWGAEDRLRWVETASRPGWTVVVCAGRPERLAETLDALARQEPAPGAAFEIVVAGPGAPGAPPVLRPAAGGPPWTVRTAPLAPGSLPGAVRHAGAALARQPWLLFLDDDVRPAPDYFRQLARLLARPEPIPRLGAFAGRLPGAARSYGSRLVDYGNFWTQQGYVRAVPAQDPWLFSAALVVSAEAYTAAGGFDPTLSHGEDVVLCARLRELGWSLGYEPDLVAVHDHGRTTLRSALTYFARNGRLARAPGVLGAGGRPFSLRSALHRAAATVAAAEARLAATTPGWGRLKPGLLLAHLVFQLGLESERVRGLYQLDEYKPASERSGDALMGRAWAARRAGRPGRARGWALAAAVLDLFQAPRW